ncbi:chromosome partitioning protein [Bdellovibrio bacteriovorus W]|nr:chromosome partitioning protein [Bdellovibrio bacteriovorus W]
MSDLQPESSNKKKGLGRGLGSLLGGPAPTEIQVPKSSTTPTQAPIAPVAPPVQAAPVDPESKIWKVAIDKLSPGEFQPRRTFEKESLQELAQSIKENGILQPIVARRISTGKLEIVAGERRWRASQLAGLHEVPVILRSFSDKEALELAIVENIQRADLNPIEEAEGYQRLITEFKLSQQQVAEKVGKDRATVANAVRLLSLTPEIRNMISSAQLSVGHAKVLLSVQEPKKQLELAKRVISEKLAVRKLEKMIQAEAKGKSEEASVKADFDSSVTQRLINGLSEELQKMLGTKVNIDYANSKGKISIHFYSDDELTNIVDRLKEGCQ